MHPLILFALFFIPGIKSSYLVNQELDDLSGKENGIVPISPPEINDLEEPRKHHENPKSVSYFKKSEETKGHLKPRYRNGYHFGMHNVQGIHGILPYKRRHEYLSSRNVNPNDLETLHGEHYSTYSETPSPSEYYKKGKRFKKEHDAKEKKLNKIKNSQHFDKTNELPQKKYRSYKKSNSEEVKVKRYGKGKKFMKPEINDDKDLSSSSEKNEFPNQYIGKVEKSIDHYDNNHLSFDKEKRKRYKRVKREEDSIESDESFHGGEYDTNSDEDKSDESLEDYEKRIIAHLLESSLVKSDNLQPYKDFIEVDIKKNENNGDTPVVEPVISKTNAYVSCNDGGDLLGCEMRRQQEGRYDQNQENKENSINKMEDQNNHEIDEAAWLKALEDEIINSGIDVQHHQ